MNFQAFLDEESSYQLLVVREYYNQCTLQTSEKDYETEWDKIIYIGMQGIQVAF